MQICNVQQGSNEWLELRAKYHTASEAAAMMGVSKYQTRNELLAQKKSGITPEVTPAQQFLFDKGHASEAAARIILEEQLGEEFYPVVAVKDNLLASVDGVTMCGTVLFEHKLWNEKLVNEIKTGEIPASHFWQLEQQLYVTGAEKVIFVISDGTAENWFQCEYRPTPGRLQGLLEAWSYFDKDLETFEIIEAAPVAVGSAPESLPALRIELTGMVTANNLKEFQSSALAVINSVNENLETDQDFADAKKAIKWCKDVEDRLKAAKEHALSQTSSIDELFKSIDAIASEGRQKRLSLTKLVSTRETSIKREIAMDAKEAFNNHVDALNKSLPDWVGIDSTVTDFNSAMKNLRTIASLRNAADTHLSQCKAAANEEALKLNGNIAILNELAAENMNLFADKGALVRKAPDDLTSAIRLRIAEHEKAEAERLEKEREKIRLEEEAKAQKTADDKLEAEREKVREEERQKAADQREQERQAQAIAAAIATVETVKADIESPMQIIQRCKDKIMLKNIQAEHDQIAEQGPTEITAESMIADDLQTKTQTLTIKANANTIADIARLIELQFEGHCLEMEVIS